MDEFDLLLDNWLEFLHYLAYDIHMKVKQFQVMRSFLVIMRKLSGNPLNDLEVALLQKFIYGVANKYPEMIAPSPVCWDVETILRSCPQMIKYLYKNWEENWHSFSYLAPCAEVVK